jgi:hypothetical protein
MDCTVGGMTGFIIIFLLLRLFDIMCIELNDGSHHQGQTAWLPVVVIIRSKDDPTFSTKFSVSQFVFLSVIIQLIYINFRSELMSTLLGYLAAEYTTTLCHVCHFAQTRRYVHVIGVPPELVLLWIQGQDTTRCTRMVHMLSVC